MVETYPSPGGMGPVSEGKNMPSTDHDPSSRDQFTATWVELTIRLGVLGLLLYFSFTPGSSIHQYRDLERSANGSALSGVRLDSQSAWRAAPIGGALLTLFSLLIVIGPATWLALGLFDSLRILSERFDLSALALPPPRETVKSWPLIGDQIYQFWNLASNNLQAALVKIAPHLKPIGSSLLHDRGGCWYRRRQVLYRYYRCRISVFASTLAGGCHQKVLAQARFGARRGIRPTRWATIRAVSRGVIGISALQAFFAGLGLMVAGIPGASLITSAVLILGIIQIGPSIVLIPLIIWSWTVMETTTALLFTAYMIPVSLLDNVLRPLVMGRGLKHRFWSF